MAGPQVLILGLDGATWDLVEPWARAGRLPHLSALMERGSRGILRSTVPATTPVAWPSIFTGVNPGKHGMFGFRSPVENSYEWRRTTSLDLARPALWDLLGAEGRRSGVFFVPFTFPARPLEGAMVTGRGSPRRLESRISHPEELGRAMADRFGEAALFEMKRPIDLKLRDIVENLIEGVHSQSDAIAWAASKDAYDLVFAVWDHTDTVAHLLWHYQDLPLPPEDGLMFRVYEAVDAGIGKVIDAVGGDPLVVVCSDHGAHPTRHRVRTPVWLSERRLYAFDPQRSGRYRTLTRADRTVGRMPAVLRRTIRAAVPAKARWRIKRSMRPLTDQVTDWSRTRVFPQPTIAEALYLNLKGREPQGTVEPDEAERMLEEVGRELREATAPDGSRLVDNVLRRDEVYWGEHAHRAADLFVEPARGVMFAPARLGEGEAVFTPEPPDLDGERPRPVCYHDPDGMILFAGPGVVPGTDLRLEAPDVTATVLRYMEATAPDDLDGRAAEEAFSALPEARIGAQTGTMPAREADLSAEEEADISRHLKDLGYIE